MIRQINAALKDSRCSDVIYINNFFIFSPSYTAHELLQPSVCKDIYRRAKLPEAGHQYRREERATPKETRGDNS